MGREGWNCFDDDGALVEKVAYPTLKQGISTLVLAVPNQDQKVEFHLRFCRTDGSGRPPTGVRAFPRLSPTQQPAVLDEPVRHDFKNPTFFKWADVKDDPWLQLPRLDNAALRDLTGIPSLTVKTDGTPWTAADGTEYNPPAQHLFLDVPQAAVLSPWIPAQQENNAMIQWLGDGTGRVFYDDVQPEGGGYRGVLHDLATGERTFTDRALANLSRDGRWGLLYDSYPDQFRLHARRLPRAVLDRSKAVRHRRHDPARTTGTTTASAHKS